VLIFIGFVIFFFALLFINQLTIELLIAYLKNNEYFFKSIELLANNEIFLEQIDDFEQIFGMKFFVIFLIMAIRYFLMLCVQLFFNPQFKTHTSVSMLGLYKLVSNLFMAPISMFIAMVCLVVLTTIIGKATWIVLLSLGIFKFLFSFFSNRLSLFLESI